LAVDWSLEVGFVLVRLVVTMKLFFYILTTSKINFINFVPVHFDGPYAIVATPQTRTKQDFTDFIFCENLRSHGDEYKDGM
jgi:hypothetical protein